MPLSLLNKNEGEMCLYRWVLYVDFLLCISGLGVLESSGWYGIKSVLL